MAAGARIYPPKFQRDVSKICSRHNVLLVLDEVATGFEDIAPAAICAPYKPFVYCFGMARTTHFHGIKSNL